MDQEFTRSLLPRIESIYIVTTLPKEPELGEEVRRHYHQTPEALLPPTQLGPTAQCILHHQGR